MKYLLKRRADDDWEEVSKTEWVKDERAAGFHNTMGQPLEPGTAGWSTSQKNITYQYGKLDQDWKIPTKA